MFVRAAALALLLLLVAPLPARTASILSSGGIRDLRYDTVVCGEDCFPSDSDDRYTYDASDFDWDLASPFISVSHHSHIGAIEMHGDGSVTKAPNPPPDLLTSGYSRFNVEFQVDEDTDFSFSGDAASFSLLGLGGEVLLQGSGPFSVQGTLHPDVPYDLGVTAVMDRNDGGGRSWRFSFALVPEPGTLALVSVGVVVLTARRRRQR